MMLGKKKPDCWQCGTELKLLSVNECDIESYSVGIAADEDGNDVEFMHEEHDRVTAFKCPTCSSKTLVYRTREKS